MEAKCLSKDRISTLPSILIENILCRVSTRDAIRTSILSRNWRYNWATIPKLVFNVHFMSDKSNEDHQPEQPVNERTQLSRKCKVLYAIHQVLLLHHGPILEFDLTMRADKTCVEIDQIILHLSRKNTVKKLTLDLELMDNFLPPYLYRLPLSVFSFHQLTDLSLTSCEFEFKPTFSGFSRLTSLSLVNVKSCRETILHLITSCPLLKHFSLITGNPEDDEYVFTIELNDLLKCLPVIEHLCISSWNIECSAPQDLPTTLVYLKRLSMYRMLFDYKLFLLFLLIKRSPNLERIDLVQEECVYDDTDSTESEINSLDDYSDIWLEHLNELKIELDFSVSKLEMEFMKLILAKSPVLKKVRIRLGTWVENNDELKMLRILIRSPRASLVAEIIVEHDVEIIVESPRE